MSILDTYRNDLAANPVALAMLEEAMAAKDDVGLPIRTDLAAAMLKDVPELIRVVRAAYARTIMHIVSVAER